MPGVHSLQNALNIRVGYAQHVVEGVGVFVHLGDYCDEEVEAEKLLDSFLNYMKEDIVEAKTLIVVRGSSLEDGAGLLCLKVRQSKLFDAST